MARITSESKAGFYPTPTSQVKLITNRLRAKTGTKIDVFDPCAGYGNTLRLIQDKLINQGANITSYGIELEKERAEACKSRLNHVLQSPYEDTRITPQSMSLLWLNPPYTNHGFERAEVTFLRDLTDPTSGKLQPGGLLGYCIPRKTLKDAAMLLALRFKNIHVYRFTDDEYPAYYQIVVFGYRREKRNTDPVPYANWLKELNDLPLLDAEDGVVFETPAAEKEVKTYLLNIITEEEVAEAIAVSPIWEMVAKYKPRPRAIMKPPVMSLKSTHIAVAIAAGAVGGSMGDHFLVGSTRRVESRMESQVDNGSKTIVREESRSIIRLFNQDGIHVLE